MSHFEAALPGVRARARPLWRPGRLHLSVYAWTSIAVTALFLGITFWWLASDHSIPVFDAGTRLAQALIVYHNLHEGWVGTALTVTSPYPPFAYLVGALGLWIGGLGVSAPVIMENLVFVPLLAVGTYNVARIAFGSRAGLLAVVFALGTPLVTAQFHVFMVDAPETAMVAFSLWLILATERFSRTWLSAGAGLAVGLGMLTKLPFVFFVAGPVLVILLRGGWRHWRGLIAFFAVAGVLALPWYIERYLEVHTIAQRSFQGGVSTANGISPPSLSVVNFLWYFWSTMNAQLYAPLFAFSIVGAVWAVWGFVRRRPVSPVAWELAVGGFVAWLAITETFVHDTRYGMPLLVYLAVFGTGWIVSLRSSLWRALATGALVLFACLNTLGASFGVGRDVLVKLPGANPAAFEAPGEVRIVSNTGFLVSGPHRDGDVLGLMKALRKQGVREITWLDAGPNEPPPIDESIFSESGLIVFAFLAGLEFDQGPASEYTQKVAVLAHAPYRELRRSPCVRLSDGSGVWVRLGNPYASGAKDYCPLRRPAFY